MSNCVVNFTGEPLENSTYYSVQYGLIVSMAYHHNDNWFITGSLPIHESNLKEELIVIEKICTQADIVKKLP